ncbi:unnamed protein product [Polarella glacialis]|uniref:Uncharacterized protein n=1 Tax=Polarella glacialis TaxID=89957 RepID=A0A813JTG8_POLGL|nr:unnamed protein product [Polarella glacialis]
MLPCWGGQASKASSNPSTSQATHVAPAAAAWPPAAAAAKVVARITAEAMAAVRPVPPQGHAVMASQCGMPFKRRAPLLPMGSLKEQQDEADDVAVKSVCSLIMPMFRLCYELEANADYVAATWAEASDVTSALCGCGYWDQDLAFVVWIQHVYVAQSVRVSVKPSCICGLGLGTLPPSLTSARLSGAVNLKYGRLCFS